MSAIVQMIRELVKAGLSGNELLAAIDRVEVAERGGDSKSPDEGEFRRLLPTRPAKHQHPLIIRAIRVHGAQHRLAQAAGCAQQLISQMLNYQLPVSAEIAIAIEKATDGAVTRSQLRPDLWPEDQP